MMRRLLLLFALLLSAGSLQAQSGDLLGRVNGLRASLGLPPYTLNGALSAAAQNQAQWMAEIGSVSHTQPDGSGPRTRAINAGYVSTDVSENIYGGTNATPDTAWTFWVNSGVHYAGMTHTRYKEIGIGIASSGWGTAYVLVFGNPGGPAFVPASANNAASGGEANGPPSYVVGVNEQGFIMHEIQPSDTLGDIALIYGYSWDDLPYMKTINGIEDNRTLQVGEIFLVPPHDGTFTPVPENAAPTATAEASVTPSPTIQITLLSLAMQPTATATPVLALAATAATMPEELIIARPPSLTPQVVAAVSTEPIAQISSVTPGRGPSQWLVAALLLQAGLLVAAGVEFMRRSRRR